MNFIARVAAIFAAFAAVAFLSASPPVLAQAGKAKAPAKAAAPASAASAWTIDARNSAITYELTHAGAPVNGAFQRWTGDIRFDPANLAGSSARITIDTRSSRTGSGSLDGTVKAAEWLSLDRHPEAVFTTTAIRAAAPAGRYEADGVLTFKGRAVPVRLPFAVAIQGDVATMTGEVALDRAALDFGRQSDPTYEWVSRMITVKVRVRATRVR